MSVVLSGDCRSVAPGSPVRSEHGPLSTLLVRFRGTPIHRSNDWNRGAFALTPLWLFNHGAPWLGATYLALSWVPLLTTVMSVYFGRHGNDYAMRHRAFDDDAHFLRVQEAWAHAGVVMWRVIGGVIGTVASLVGLGLILEHTTR